MSVVFASVCLNAQGQDKAYWQGLSQKNPALIATPSDWIYGGYGFTNQDMIKPLFFFGFDKSLGDKVGTIGADFSRMKLGYETYTEYMLNYAYTAFSNEKAKLSFGLGVGLQSIHNDLSDLKLYPDSEPDPFINSRWNKLKVDIGVLYSSKAVDFGFSYYRYEKLNENFNRNNYSELTLPDVFTLLGAYRINVNETFVIEPNAFFEFMDSKTGKYLGVFIECYERVWFGYTNIDFNDLHSLSLGIDLKGKYRVGYGYDFSKKILNERLNIHEFLLAFRIN